MHRLPAVIVSLILLAFALTFLMMAFIAPGSPPAMHLIGVVICLLFAAATSCGAVMALAYAVTGKDYF